MTKLKILLIHNFYQHSGGEDRVFRTELDLLKSNNHDVSVFSHDNHSIEGLKDKLVTTFNVTYSEATKKIILKNLRVNRPDIVHVHNFFPLVTPSVYDACIEREIPVVQTLHNYRTICSNATLMRAARICEKCISGFPYHAVLHRCYKNSIIGSIAVSRMISYHRKKQTWQNKVDRFIALTHFAKQKFIEAGFPANKIVVKPNFHRIESQNTKNGSVDNIAPLFAGRLSSEKGVATMINAWNTIDIQLKIVGDGPLMAFCKKHSKSNISFLGNIKTRQVLNEMRKASFLVMPSECYEGFPMVLVEAFAHGLPVVTTRLGSMAEIVEDGVTGLHFEAGNPRDLAEKVTWLHNHPEARLKMGSNAYNEYIKNYTPEYNHEILMDIYKQAIEENRNRTY